MFPGEDSGGSRPVRPLSELVRDYLVSWIDLDWPIRWEEVFGRSGPLVVEVGFGSGEFLLQEAGSRPDANFVGIERAWGSMQRLFRRLDAAGLANVRALEGDASHTLGHLFAPNSVERVFINFSDPWPKDRHHGRRLIQPAFAATVGEKLAPGGEVTIVTDHSGYADWIAEVLADESALRSRFDSAWVDRLPGRKQTKYERKAVDAGSPVHYFVYERAGGPPGPEVHEEMGTMPNVILEGAINREEMLADSAPRSWQTVHAGVPVVVKLSEIYIQPQAGHRLVVTMVREGELIQNFGISVVLRPNGQVLVKLSSVGHPRPTWGVKEAVWRVAQLILDQFPHARVNTSTVVSQWSEGPGEGNGRHV